MSDSPYLLSLDLGASSVGWAAFKMDEDGNPIAFLLNKQNSPAIGAHIFEAGVDNYNGTGNGEEQSRNATRRTERQIRRQGRRRARRMAKVWLRLAEVGLLPQVDTGSQPFAVRRDACLKKLDRQLADELGVQDGRNAIELLPYLLRKKGLDDSLTLYQLGKAFFNLSQRRGYESNRKSGKEKDGAVAKGIKESADRIDPTGADGKARTLGELMYQDGLAGKRIRNRYTARSQYKAEFDTLWEAQQPHNPNVLTDEFRKVLHKAIFYQRPLKSQKHLIGACDIYDGVRYKPQRTRAPWALLLSQQFRLLQKLNDIRVIEKNAQPRELSADEREMLRAELECSERVKFSDMRTLFGFKKNTKFNLELGGDKEIRGNHTAANIIEAVGKDLWLSWSPAQKNQLIEDLWSFEKQDALERRLIKTLNLSVEQARNLATEFYFEEGYGSYSRQALETLIPLMEEGVQFATAKIQAFGGPLVQDVHSKLPPAVQFVPSLRNPIVLRVLTELRRVVNALIKEYGKPALIRIELARDMKNSAKRRKEINDTNRKREKERNFARKFIKENTHILNPKRNDIEKYMLWKECNKQCPFTGETIDASQLFNGEVEVEHILPFSKSLDNRFTNKTLCFGEENRKKSNRSPAEAYSEEELKPILARVEKFKNRGKLRLFTLKGEELEEHYGGFTEADLRNTAWAAKLSCDFLGMLYGLQPGGAHRVDAEGVQRIQVTNGSITAHIRNEWELNRILSDGGKKSRADHRHHAVDAVAIAFTTPGMIQKLSHAAFQAAETGKRRFGGRGKVTEPWPGFYDDVKEAIVGTSNKPCINVSHRVDTGINGALHDGTNYSLYRYDENGQRDPDGAYSHIRKPVTSLKEKNIKDDIVDPVVREVVLAAFVKAGKKSEKLGDPELAPRFGPQNKIVNSVRIRKKNKPIIMVPNHRYRSRAVEGGSNHHIEIVEFLDKKGEKKWEGHVVSTDEAYQRRRRKEPIIKRDHGDGKKFICSLVGGDMFIWEEAEGVPAVFRVRTIGADAKIAFVRVNDARMKGAILDHDKEVNKAFVTSGKDKPIGTQGFFGSKSTATLLAGNLQKVKMLPLGEVRPVNE